MQVAVSEKAMKDAVTDFFRGFSAKRKNNSMFVEEAPRAKKENDGDDLDDFLF